MFWGCVVTENTPYILHGDVQFGILHISNAALGKSNESGKISLKIRKGKEKFTLVTLEKDKMECFALDLYVKVNHGVALTVSGKGEIHVTGYFEGEEDLDSKDDDEDEALLESPLTMENIDEFENEDESDSEEEDESIGKKPTIKNDNEENSESDENAFEDSDDDLKNIISAKKRMAEKPLSGPPSKKSKQEKKQIKNKHHKN